MSENDLRAVLGRAAGEPGPRPELATLWARSGARRQRARLLAVAAGVAVLALVVGAVALASSDGDQDVLAGPAGPSAGAPPVESTDLPITIALAAGPVVDGVPTARPGEPMTMSYVGTGGFGRDGVAAWERWDGTTWVGEHTLVVERAREPGSGEVLPADAVVDPGELRFEEEVDRYPTPEDLMAGWYRVCVPMHQYSGVGPTTPAGATTTDPAGTVAGEAEPTVTAEPGVTGSDDPAPTTTEPVGGIAPDGEHPFGVPIRPCAQLRAVADVPVTTTTAATGPPPAEPESAGVDLFVVGVPPYPAGGSIAVQVLRDGGVTLGFDTSWEQWDGSAWVRTHLVLGAPYDGVEPDVVPIADAPAVRPGTLTSEDVMTPLVVVIPPVDELTSPWSRVCVDAEPAGLGRPCVQVAIDGAGGTPPTVHGDPATWTVDPQQPPAPEARAVTVLVTRRTCSGGATGALLEPQVQLRADEVVITVDAVPEPRMHSCPGNDAVPVTVALGEPIGDRALVDGWCAGSASPDPCEGTGERRWPLP